MRRFACLSLLPLLAAVACTKEPVTGGLMLSMRTDLKVPVGVDVVGVYIVRVKDQRTTQILSTEVAAVYIDKDDNEKHVALPGTLAIASDGDPDSTIQVRIVAYDENRVPVAMREARVRVPTDATKALPMPLLWMNTEDVADADPSAGGPSPITRTSAGLGFLDATSETSVDAFARFQSDFCGADQTLDDTGACATIDIDPNALEDFQAKGLRSGLAEAVERDAGERGPMAGGDGVVIPPDHDFCDGETAPDCFNMVACIATERDDDLNFQTVAAEPTQIEGIGTPDCYVSLSEMAELPGGIAALDVAVVIETANESGATCTESGTCYIALDQRSGVTLERDQLRLKLPPGVCRKISKGSVGRILASPLCKPKEVDQEICVNTEGFAIDAGCRNGSGWNGKGDPPPPPPPDATTPDECAMIPNATGFWVGSDRAHVITSDGALYSFSNPQFGACLNDTPTITSSTLETGHPYRLLGSDTVTGAIAVMGGEPRDRTRATAALVRFGGNDSDGVDLVSNPNEDGASGAFFSAGAFFASLPATADPGAVFLASTQNGLVTVRLAELPGSRAPVTAVGPPLFTSATNLVGTGSGGGAQVTLATHVDGAMMLVSCTYTSGECRSPASLSGPVPTALTTTAQNTFYILAEESGQVKLFKVQTDADASAPFTPLHTLPMGYTIYPETTIAVADDANGIRAYFGTNKGLVVAQTENGTASFRVAASAALGHSVRAVQIFGKALYWLDVDDASPGRQGTLRRHALDDSGAFRE